MRLGPVPATLSLLAAATVAVAPARAATVSTPLPLAACPTELSATTDGTVRLLTRTQARGRWTAAASSIDPAGVVTAGPRVSRAWKRPNAVRSVFTDDGIAVAYETGQPKPETIPLTLLAASAKAKPTVSAIVVGAGGASTPQVLSDPSREAELYRVYARGGATVVQFRQAVRGAGWLQTWIAVRPRGEERFRKAVSLKSAIRARFGDDQVYLGPDGSGIVVSVPQGSKLPVSARRISVDGRVGPAMDVTRRRTDIAVATAAVAADGGIVVATTDTAKPDRYGRSGVFVATLAPGASRFSAPRIVATERGDLSDGLAIAVDGAGRVHAAAFLRLFTEDPADYHPRFLTFSGAADQLVRGPDVDGNLAGLDRPVLTPTADGGVALSWEGYEKVGPGDGDDVYRRTQHVAFRAVDGTWSAPAPFPPPASLSREASVTNRGSAALPGGGIAMAYATERTGGRTACALVRVTP